MKTNPPRLDDLEDRLTPHGLTAAGVAAGGGYVPYLAEYAQGRLLVASSVAPPNSERIADGVYRVELPKGRSVGAGTTWAYTLKGVTAVQPDFRILPASDDTLTPDDPLYPQQYAHQVIGSERAWVRGTGTGDHVVAIVDTGVDVTHPDLAANIWTNPGETPGNRVDDDGNGYIDDIHGWNFATNNSDITDPYYVHGTPVAGVIGAVGNNGIGVSGVAWTARIAVAKIFGNDGVGYIGNAVRAMDYILEMGIPISNHSYGGGGGGPVVEWVFQRAMDAGHVVVASAGNDGADLKNYDTYPASIDGVISVGSTSSWSNYDTSPIPSRRDVTLDAPDHDIRSTQYGDYGNRSGTSFASPQVTGALVVLWDAEPTLTAAQLVHRLKATVTPVPSQAGRTKTGGRLDFARLMTPPAVSNEPRDPYGDPKPVALEVAP